MTFNVKNLLGKSGHSARGGSYMSSPPLFLAVSTRTQRLDVTTADYRGFRIMRCRSVLERLAMAEESLHPRTESPHPGTESVNPE